MSRHPPCRGGSHPTRKQPFEHCPTLSPFTQHHQASNPIPYLVHHLPCPPHLPPRTLNPHLGPHSGGSQVPQPRPHPQSHIGLHTNLSPDLGLPPHKPTHPPASNIASYSSTVSSFASLTDSVPLTSLHQVLKPLHSPFVPVFQDQEQVPSFVPIQPSLPPMAGFYPIPPLSTLPPLSSSGVMGFHFPPRPPPIQTFPTHIPQLDPQNLMPQTHQSGSNMATAPIVTPVEHGPCIHSTPEKPSRNLTKPHPHLVIPLLYITSVPSDVPECEIAETLRECLPVRIKLDKETVPRQKRLLPDTHYDWMPRHAEKALSSLLCHPFMIQKNIFISPFPPPLLLPLTDPNTPARIIRPIKFVTPFSEGTPPDYTYTCPSPGEVWEAAREWGSMRSIFVWVEAGTAQDGSDQPCRNWRAKIEFWYEDEARRFEHGFGQTGSLLKGWQIAIMKDPTYPLMPLGTTPQPMPLSFGTTFTASPLSTDNMQFVSKPPKNLSPEQIHGCMGVTYVRDPILNPTAVFSMGVVPPSTPPGSASTVPWANHAPPFLMNTPLSPPLNSPKSSKSQSLQDQQQQAVQFSTMGTTLKTTTSSASMRSSTNSKRRNWSANKIEVSGEGVKSLGFVTDDGLRILHGPGQHILPAPPSGPGSTSVSGLVDYCNIFVKNLDPDISSHYFAEIFEKLGRVVSAKIMRDELGRHRGYGFVSYETPQEAAKAIQKMHGQRLGNQILSVTLHEPRRLRPDKIAERHAPKKTISEKPDPRRIERGRVVNTSRGGADTDEIRSLSPASRKVALARGVTSHVRTYARNYAIPEDYIEPTIRALVNHDLALIPLLHDSVQLQAKVAETIGVLQEDPDLNVNFGIRRPGAPITAQENQKAKSPLSIEKEKEAKLWRKVQRIDPVHVDTVSAHMKAGFESGELNKCLESKSYLSLKGLAKKLVNLKLAEEEKDSMNNSREMMEGVVEWQEQSDSSHYLSSSLGARRRATDGSVHSEIESFDSQECQNDNLPSTTAPNTTSIASPTTETEVKETKEEIQELKTPTLFSPELTIERLASLPASQAIKHLMSDENQDTLKRLGVERPDEKKVEKAKEWINILEQKSIPERKADLANYLAKLIESQMSKSAKLKIARELVNAESDDSAMCQLMMYPNIIKQKIEANRRMALAR